MTDSEENSPTNRVKLMLYGNRSIPLYRMVKEELIKFVQKKGIKSGMALPTEKELAAQFDVSVGTVRRAIAELVSERIVIRQQGRGTFLTPYDISRQLNSFWHIRRRDGGIDIPIVSTHQFLRQEATGEVAENLKLQVGDYVFMIVNTMAMDGRVVLLDKIYVSCDVFKGMTRDRFVARDATIYDFYREVYGFNVVKTVDRISGAVADEDVATYLDCDVGAPMLHISRIAYSFGDIPIEYRSSVLDSEHHEYVDVTGGDVGRFGR